MFWERKCNFKNNIWNICLQTIARKRVGWGLHQSLLSAWEPAWNMDTGTQGVYHNINVWKLLAFWFYYWIFALGGLIVGWLKLKWTRLDWLRLDRDIKFRWMDALREGVMRKRKEERDEKEQQKCKIKSIKSTIQRTEVSRKNVWLRTEKLHDNHQPKCSTEEQQ